MSEPKVRRPMTVDERRMAGALGGCTFVPGIASKRFARDMATIALREPGAEITEKQAETLRSLVHRYRRQIAPEIVALAAVRAAALPPESQ